MSHLALPKTVFLTLSIAALSGSLVTGCGSSSSTTTTTDTTTTDTTTTDTISKQDYNGPGSKWDISLDTDGTFHIDHRPSLDEAIDYTVDGDYVRNDSGFVTLTVTGGTGTNAPAAGSEAWGVEVPGYAFMLKPVDSDQLIAMVTSGECPSGDFDANWVMVNVGDNHFANEPTSDFAGTFSFDSTTQIPSLPHTYALTTGFPEAVVGGIGDGSVTCDQGILDVPGATMYLTANGGAIVHTGSDTAGDETDDQFIFALSQKELTSIGESDGEYAGMLFDANMANGSQINPIAMSCTSGTCTGTLVSDPAAGTTTSGSVTVTLSSSLNEIGSTTTGVNGFITGSIEDDNGGTGNLICMVDPDAVSSGKKIVNCVGQSPGDNADMFNVLFVSK